MNRIENFQIFMLRGLISALAVLSLSACSSIPSSTGVPGSDGKIPWVSVDHECLGLCVGPSYVVTLFADGTVVFEGKYNVKEKSVHVKHLDPQKMAPVFAKIEKVDFWETDSAFGVKHHQLAGGNGEDETIRLMPFDSPVDTITARDGEKYNRVEGANFSSQDMINLVTTIDQTADVSDWVGTLPDWRAEWKREHGD